MWVGRAYGVKDTPITGQKKTGQYGGYANSAHEERGKPGQSVLLPADFAVFHRPLAAAESLALAALLIFFLGFSVPVVGETERLVLAHLARAAAAIAARPAALILRRLVDGVAATGAEVPSS